MVIPIANLFKPFQAMKEIWQVSKDPSFWQTQVGSSLLGWWWGLWLFAGVLGNIVFRMPATNIPELQAVTKMSMFASVESIVVTLVAMKLVKSVIRNQDFLVNESKARLGLA